MKKITQASEQQWEEIRQLKEEWINKQTTQHYNDIIIKTVKNMWHRLGHNPIVIIAESPLSCILMYGLYSQFYSQLSSQLNSQLSIQLDSQLSSQLNSQLRSQLGSQLHSQLDSQLRSQLHSQLSSQLGSQLHSQLHSQLRSQLNSQLSSQLDSQLHSQLNSQLRSQLHSQLRSQLGSQLHSQLRSQFDLSAITPYHSWWWSTWSGWYVGAQILGVKLDSDLLDIFQDWCWHCPFVIPYDNIVMVSKRPVEIHWQDEVLHNNDKQSIKFADGWGVWTVNGVQVDQQIVEFPESQTIEQINKEENEEIKRIRIERFGWTKYLKQIDAKVIEHRYNNIEGTEESLMHGNNLRVLVCACPSTKRIYAMEIPQEIETCENAQQWLRGDKQGYCIGAS